VGGLAAHHLRPTMALALLHGDAGVGALDEDDEGYEGDHAGNQKDDFADGG